MHEEGGRTYSVRVTLQGQGICFISSADPINSTYGNKQQLKANWG